jgi:hypothetical protein
METLQTRERIESLCGATNIAEEIRLLSISSPDTIILDILHLLRVPSDAEFAYSFLSYVLHRRFVHEVKERSIIERRVLNEKLDSLLVELVAARFSPTLLHVLERCILEFREQEAAVAREQGYKILVDWIRTCLSRSVEEKNFVLKHFDRVEVRSFSLSFLFSSILPALHNLIHVSIVNKTYAEGFVAWCV